jgi:hypothetical protein
MMFSWHNSRSRPGRVGSSFRAPMTDKYIADEYKRRAREAFSESEVASRPAVRDNLRWIALVYELMAAEILRGDVVQRLSGAEAP